MLCMQPKKKNLKDTFTHVYACIYTHTNVTFSYLYRLARSHRTTCPTTSTLSTLLIGLLLLATVRLCCLCVGGCPFGNEKPPSLCNLVLEWLHHMYTHAYLSLSPSNLAHTHTHTHNHTHTTSICRAS